MGSVNWHAIKSFRASNPSQLLKVSPFLEGVMKMSPMKDSADTAQIALTAPEQGSVSQGPASSLADKPRYGSLLSKLS